MSLTPAEEEFNDRQLGLDKAPDERAMRITTAISFSNFRRVLCEAIKEHLQKRLKVGQRYTRKELRELTGLHSTQKLSHLVDYRFDKLDFEDLLLVALVFQLPVTFQWSVADQPGDECST
jgi:hypothetical protein